MRRLATFILMCILLFNTVGYRFFINYVEQVEDLHLQTRLDKNDYSNEQLIELKIPLNLPYQLNRPEYERCDGEITVQGTLYKYVKRKVLNDTLYVQCLPDFNTMKLRTAGNDISKQASDYNTSSLPGKSKNTGVNGNVVFEYEQCFASFATPLMFVSTVKQLNIAAPAYLLSRPHISPGQPPDTANT